MSQGVIVIKITGLIWEIEVKVPGFGAGFSCKPGWKNRRGVKGIGSESPVEGAIEQATDDLLTKFFKALPAACYVHILSRKDMKIVFDRQVDVSSVQGAIALIIKDACKLDSITIKDKLASDPRGSIVEIRPRRRLR